MDNHIEVYVGDWTRDGHSQFDVFFIKSNLTMDQLLSAYKEASEKLGFDFASYFEGYDECWMPASEWDKLVELGFPRQYSRDLDQWTHKNGQVRVYNADDYLEVWMFIAHLGNPNLSWTNSCLLDNKLRIGGYGLYK